MYLEETLREILTHFLIIRCSRLYYLSILLFIPFLYLFPHLPALGIRLKYTSKVYSSITCCFRWI